MTLEKTVQALERVMKGEQVDKTLLRDHDVQDSIRTYFAEKEVRPTLVEVIRLPTVMQQYLSLSVEGREALETLRQKRPEYSGLFHARFDESSLGRLANSLRPERRGLVFRSAPDPVECFRHH